MTIKIIDEGPDPSVVKEVLCKNCGVKLSYVPNDIQSRVVSSFGDTTTLYYITCLVEDCKKTITVKKYYE